jgi:ankyrin repeat protein
MQGSNDLQTQLEQASMDGTLADFVRALFDEGFGFSDIVNPDTGDTILHVLSAIAPLELLHDLLTTYPVNINIKNRAGETALYQVTRDERKAIASLLLFFDANPKLGYPSGKRTLHPVDYDFLTAWKEQFLIAINLQERLDLVNELKEKKISPLTPIDEFDNTILHFMIESGDLEFGSLILKELPKGYIDCVNFVGETPLIQAVRANKQLLTHLLMNYGADPRRQDKTGVSALGYSRHLSTPRRFVLAPKDITRQLNIASEFSEIFESNDFLRKLEELKQRGIKLTDPIDGLDNSLLHVVMQTAPLAVIHQVLQTLRHGEIDVQNSMGETPLHQACMGNCKLKAKLLLQYGADPHIQDNYQGSAKSLMENDDVLQDFVTDQSLNIGTIFKADDLLQNSISNQSTEHVLDSLIHSGLSLDTPIDVFDNTILHWLINSVPIHQLKAILGRYQNFNINSQNILGETPLMQAAGSGRQLAVSLLLAHGADMSLLDSQGLTAEDFALNANAPIEFTTKALSDEQTVYEFLIAYFAKEKSNIESLPENQRAEYLFHHFNKFVRHCQWRYDGTTKDYEQQFLLDCNMSKPYVVNCFDLANAFASLLKAYGVKDVSTHVYHNMRSKPFAVKSPNIKGGYVCFDEEVQAKAFKKGYFEFDNHCVVKCMGRYFDPTFCCSYDNENDIVESYDAPKVGPDQQYINIYVDFPIDLQPSKSPKEAAKLKTLQQERILNLKLLSALHQLFPQDSWHHIRRSNKIMVNEIKGEGCLEIILNDNSIDFTSSFIDPKLIINIVGLWREGMPALLQASYKIDASQHDLIMPLKEMLKQHGIVEVETVQQDISSPTERREIQVQFELEDPSSMKRKPISIPRPGK